MQNFLNAARPLIVDSLGVIVFAALMAMHADLRIAIAIGVAAAIGGVARSPRCNGSA
jgi:intracellular septation protein